MAKEGRRLKTIDPMNAVSPFIMVNRSGASNLFSDRIEITAAEKYILKKRAEGLKGFGMLHLFLAAYVRTVSQRPGINRFIRGQRIYARNGIEIQMTIKKTLRLDAPETCINAEYTPDCTADDVYHIFNELVDNYKKTDEENNFDIAAKVFRFIPGVLLKFVVHLLKTLDYFGLLPRFLTKLSPFHGSFFITSMGSLGIPPVFHHLYDFGNLPVFMSYGAKYEEYSIEKDGTVAKHRYIDFNVVTDERICDGHYYASAFKYLKNIFKNPEVLDNPPETIVEDIK